MKRCIVKASFIHCFIPLKLMWRFKNRIVKLSIETGLRAHCFLAARKCSSNSWLKQYSPTLMPCFKLPRGYRDFLAAAWARPSPRYGARLDGTEVQAHWVWWGPVRLAETWMKLAEKNYSGWIIVRENIVSAEKTSRFLSKPNGPYIYLEHGLAAKRKHRRPVPSSALLPQLIDHTSATWDTAKLHKFFTQTDREAIMSIYLCVIDDNPIFGLGIMTGRGSSWYIWSTEC